MIVLALLVILTLALLIRSVRKPNNFPPGPPRLPLVGSIPFMGSDLRKTITAFHKKYGPVFGLYLANKPWIAICDYNLYKESMNKAEFQGRPILDPMKELFFPDKEKRVAGLFLSNGQEWLEQRRFVLRSLRDMGFGKRSMEVLIMEEAEKLIDAIKKDIADGNGGPISLYLRMNVGVLNALWKMVSGKKLEYDDPELNQLVSLFNDFFAATNRTGPLLVFPWLRYFAPDLAGYTKMKQTFEECYKFIGKAFVEHVESYDSNEPRDLMDLYITEMKLSEKEKVNDSGEGPDDSRQKRTSFRGTRGYQNLLVTCANLFLGGSETTSNTMMYSIWYMAKYPHIQERLVQEIRTAIGFDRQVSLADRPNTPYIEAFVHEIIRITSLAFSGIPRQVMDDTHLNGYFIPKGTNVISGLYEILHDPTYWKDPDTFNPDRFIDPVTKAFVPDERVVAFGSGRRICIGVNMAYIELYLFLVAFLQQFHFSDPDPQVLEPFAGLTLCCPNYTVVIKPRDQSTQT